MEDFYAVLEIQREATELEIKRAYVRKVREFPPDLHPDQFKSIRRAYETLSNPGTRREYDTMSVHGEEINELMQLGVEAMEREEFDEAATCFKRLLMIEPGLHNARNQLALAYSYNGNYEKALVQSRKLIESEPDNATYHYNVGVVLKAMEQTDEGLLHLQRAAHLDPYHVNILFDLVDAYETLERYEEGREVIEAALSDLEADDFCRFVYLFRLLKLEAHTHDPNGISTVMKRVEELLLHHPEEESYVAQRFAALAYQLFEVKLYGLAYQVTERAVELDPDNELIQELHEETKARKPLYEEYDQLREDELISHFVRRVFTLYLFGDTVEEEEFEQYNEEALRDLYDATQFLPDEIMSNIRRLVVMYPGLYEARKEILQNTMDLSKKAKALKDQYKLMQEDAQIIHPLKRLIALMMSRSEEEEFDYYFEDIMDELNAYNAGNIATSLRRLRSKYDKLFELNPSFLGDLLPMDRHKN